jgi:histidinol-phosphate aminotransferase
MTPPTAPASYSWEATNEGIASRFGIPLERVARFDLNTSPEPPAFVAEILARGRFETPVAEYPPGDYRRLVEAAAGAYGVEPVDVIPGAGADEILDLCAKAFLPPGGSSIVPVPTYAMYRVLTEQRPARVLAVPRLPAERGYALDVPAVRRTALDADAAIVWICNPGNPTGGVEPAGTIEILLAGLAADAAAAGRPGPVVVLDEAYAEFVGASLHGLRSRYSGLVTVRTASKAYALAGLRVGFAIGTAETIGRLALYRPPGSVSTVSATIVAEALRRPAEMRANVERIAGERARLTAALGALGWSVAPSVTNFVLVDRSTRVLAARTAEGLMSRGLVPRTFGADHPLANHLRITVRSPEEDDRLIEAATEIAAREER